MICFIKLIIFIYEFLCENNLRISCNLETMKKWTELITLKDRKIFHIIDQTNWLQGYHCESVIPFFNVRSFEIALTVPLTSSFYPIKILRKYQTEYFLSFYKSYFSVSSVISAFRLCIFFRMASILYPGNILKLKIVKTWFWADFVIFVGGFRLFNYRDQNCWIFEKLTKLNQFFNAGKPIAIH